MSAKPALRDSAAPEPRPGRNCPLPYRYSPRVFDREPELEADVLYVVGGLYGNLEALAGVHALAEREGPAVKLVFNGDFHWFDVRPDDFSTVTREVLRHAALRGNVETEVAVDESDAGCGCAYPADVSDAEVSRSNEIMTRLRATARLAPESRERLGSLPMHLTARVGEARIGIVHGDAASLAGWGFAQDRMDEPAHARWIASAFRDARVDAFASTHTCLPALRLFEVDGRRAAVANNGAAGMPNFAGMRHGILTRIATRAFAGPERVYGAEVAGAHVEALRVDYDHARWLGRFLASWPPGSPAHASYHRRIVEGPRHDLALAAPRIAAAA
ncbi:MAG TPA: hypothetical protein VHQ02_05635 [Usitatibacter sp.]|nr:hypothetical protein [Usitatibacter sp.]